MSRNDHLITAAELAAELGGEHPPVVVDVRWQLGRAPEDNRADFDAAHIAGAVFADLDSDLSDHSAGDPTLGRHPLPSPADFEATVRGWGVRAGTPVVVCDDISGQAAARAWWLLRWAGHESVRVLDGGVSAWTAAGLPVVSSAEAGSGERTGSGETASGAEGELDSRSGTEFRIRPGSMPTVDADGIAALISGGGIALDARAAERYAGEVEPMDPQAGHIPGAVSAPTAGALDSRGCVLSDDELEARFAGLGVKAPAEDGQRVAVYCGSGVTACHAALSLAVCGVAAELFPASWSGWSNDPARPVATGRS